MPSSRRSASRSPSTASPSRLRFSLAPPSRSAAIAGPSLSGRASTTRCETISRRARRAIGTTGEGSTGATAPPTLTAPRRYHGRNSGASGAIRDSVDAAAVRLSGRMTPSTNPIVKGRPFGSLRTPARRCAEASAGNSAASATQRAARSIARGARSPDGADGAVSGVSCMRSAYVRTHRRTGCAAAVFSGCG